jgi:phosphoserine phosphatase
MIGDGVTDMEAKPTAAAFIGFGGNVVREKVKAGADWFVTDFNDLIQALR